MTIVDVRWLQDALNRFGASLVIDGAAGPRTRAAVREFQARTGLTVDGIAGPRTVAALIARGVPPPSPDAAGPSDPSPVERLDLAFWVKFIGVANDVGISPYDLAIIIGNESGFDPAAQNPRAPAKPVAVGLNQINPPSKLAKLGWTAGPEAFLKAPAVNQLPIVKAFYDDADRSFRGGKALPYANAEEAYLINFTPAFWPHRNEPNFVIGDKSAPPGSQKRQIYDGNPPFDANGDGLITMSDIAAEVAKLRKSRVTRIAHERIAAVLGQKPPGTAAAGGDSGAALLLVPLLFFLSGGVFA